MPPPLLRRLLSPVLPIRNAANTGPSFSAQATSWKSPDDILSILMLIGGDIVQRAVAQLAGTGPGPFCPVAFSFGWLAYSVSALTSAVGDGRLLPKPDINMYVVNAKTGYTRDNASWLVARLLRDHEVRKFKGGSLTIAFYHTSDDPARRAGVPSRDWLYWSGVLVIVTQLAIAIIPGSLHGNWIVLMVTAGGTLLALVGSGLGQWRDEKYAARPIDPDKGREVVVLTRGNGSTFAMVVISDRVGIRVEDLAGGRDKRRTITSVMTATLFILWLVLLLTVEGLEGDAWYLLAVGGLGMIQNVLAAGVTRSADALGFHFREPSKEDFIKERKVMQTLMKAEEREPGVGLSLLPLFFPGDLWPQEQEYWEVKRKERNAAELERRALMMRGAPKLEGKAVAITQVQEAEKGHRRNDTAVTFVEDPSPRISDQRSPVPRKDTFSTVVSEPDSVMMR
ncbi:hypothetical protein L226DRAFT_454129 [Lentinus tigrinus ALCF2SS1-7]|uniref:Uncharacterized protein n=1 Tax=Lentinus tigrinus ALCF2SS1-6 TaxID=1328759 RepID=A0A5C2SRB0_9APHY|nr:hypothetical protein L227DRAFT_649148 [Lentinus tigrinus ALCF2SS1-6]RPD80356.1 hypothetical protein L226DRAFT_454129 [Lentinus tigrinus ALCF2SS1-7]